MSEAKNRGGTTNNASTVVVGFQETVTILDTGSPTNNIEWHWMRRRNLK
jgi:hypothetical protein